MFDADQNKSKEPIETGPPVSIDMIVCSKNECLLGPVNNVSVKEKWSVPGGRMKKGETLDQAFERISEQELGTKLTRKDALFRGVYEHIYDDPHPGTRYLVLAYQVDEESDKSLNDKHGSYWWASKDTIQTDKVHENTKRYFEKKDASICSMEQYTVLANRRNSTNTMLWQAPALCLTALAFLLSTAGNQNSYSWVRIAACALSALVAFVTLQLFGRHRALEAIDSDRLERFESQNAHKGLAVLHARPEVGPRWAISLFSHCSRRFSWLFSWLWAIPSNLLWKFALFVFVLASLFLLWQNLTPSYSPPSRDWGPFPWNPTNTNAVSGATNRDETK